MQIVGTQSAAKKISEQIAVKASAAIGDTIYYNEIFTNDSAATGQ